MSEEKKSETKGDVARHRAMLVVESDLPIMDTGKFEHMQRVAKIMASSSLVPQHLLGQSPDAAVSNCFLVVNQALRWRMDPFAVAQHIFVHKGKLGYEGKLIAAVINTNPALDGPLDYEYNGVGPDRTIRVIGVRRGENKPREVTGTVKDWCTDNANWSKAPDQMLAYRGAREWARRWLPQVILGVYSDDEVTDMTTLQQNASGVHEAPPPPRRADYVEPPPRPTQDQKPDTAANVSVVTETYELVSTDGEVVSFGSPSDYARQFIAAMQELSGEQLDGYWETNSPLLADLAIAAPDGERIAQDIRDAYKRRLDELDVAMRASIDGEKDSPSLTDYLVRLPTIEATGKPNYLAWVAAFKQALARDDAQAIKLREQANRTMIDTMPSNTKMTALKLISARKMELGIPMENPR